MRAQWLLVLAAWPGAAEAADPLAGVRIGMSVERAVARLGGGATWTSDEPQALAEGLVRTRLLEAIHRSGGTPLDPAGGLDPAAFAHLGRGRTDAPRPFAVAGGAEGLRFALVRIPTPVDPRFDGRGWSERRLQPLFDALASLRGYRLTPVEPDRYGNAFAWRGRGGGGQLWVRYWPAADELWVLLHP